MGVVVLDGHHAQQDAVKNETHAVTNAVESFCVANICFRLHAGEIPKGRHYCHDRLGKPVLDRSVGRGAVNVNHDGDTAQRRNQADLGAVSGERERHCLNS